MSRKDVLGLSYMISIAGAIVGFLAASTDDFYTMAGQYHVIGWPMIITAAALMAAGGIIRRIAERRGRWNS